MNPLIKKLEEILLPEFEEIAEKIREEIQDVLVIISSSPTGSQTPFQGHDFYIDCILTNASIDETDNVALGVELCHITTTPRICADVSWSSPNCYTEDQFYEWYGSFTENGLKVSDEVLEDFSKHRTVEKKCELVDMIFM